jgi:hypothetical protein
MVNKKTGVVLALFAGTFALCCGGIMFTLKSTFSQVQTAVNKDKEFLREALTATAADWNVDTFLKYADVTFKDPDHVERTKNMFKIFKQKLGKLKLLDEVKQAGGKEAFHIGTQKTGPDREGLHAKFQVNAEFEKGKGKFEVTVINNKDEKKIIAIALKSNEVMGLSAGEAKKAKTEISKPK